MVSSHIQKLSDDCKVYRSVPTAEDIDILQEDINNLCQWSKDWQMLFNVKKCKVLQIGHNNAYCDYSMNGEILQSVTDRAVTIHRYGLGQYHIDTLGCCIVILSDILLAANLVFLTSKYIFKYILFLQCKCSLLKTRSNGQIRKSNDRLKKSNVPSKGNHNANNLVLFKCLYRISLI